MTTDRLIGITMYLLNRNVVTAKELAERFEVSVWTIVRDLGALSIAGKPQYCLINRIMNRSYMQIRLCRNRRKGEIAYTLKQIIQYYLSLYRSQI